MHTEICGFNLSKIFYFKINLCTFLIHRYWDTSIFGYWDIPIVHFINQEYVLYFTFSEVFYDVLMIFVSVGRVELRAARARSQNLSQNRSLSPLSLLVNRPRRKLRTDVNSYLSLLHLSYNSNFDTFLSPIHLQPHLLISFILTLVVFSHL